MHYLNYFQSGGSVNQIAWHKKRYTPEEIRKIQVALNKQALGRQIAVDGIMGPETLNAIKEFQNQHKDSLIVDGLVGDKTASALGISNLGDSSLTATRKGQYQGRKAPGKISGVSAAENARAKAYYTSQEMLDYLLNPSNTYNADYYNHYQNALQYVSPAIAARLRYINNEGDYYDEDTAKQSNEARSRQIGIANFKQDLASGALKLTPDNLEQYAKKYHLSVEEMNELLADPTALAAAGHNADVTTNAKAAAKAKNEMVQKSVQKGMNDAGVTILKTAANPMQLLYGAMTWDGNGNPSEHYASTSTELSDALGWQDIPVISTAVDIVGNPWSWPTLGEGIYALGKKGKDIGKEALKNYTLRSRDAQIYANNARTGTRSIGTTSNPRNTTQVFIDGQPINETVALDEVAAKNANLKSGQWKYGNVPHNKGMVKENGHYVKLKRVFKPGEESQLAEIAAKHPRHANELIQLKKPWKAGTPTKDILKNIGVPGAATLVGTGIQSEVNDNYSLQGPLPPIEVPVMLYDPSVTYGPYTNVNRVVFKQGGSLNYLNYIK